MGIDENDFQYQLSGKGVYVENDSSTENTISSAEVKQAQVRFEVTSPLNCYYRDGNWIYMDGTLKMNVQSISGYPAFDETITAQFGYGSSADPTVTLHFKGESETYYQ